jgi:hypothetical protein
LLVIVTGQAPVPEQAPFQPPKPEPVAAAAASVTDVPETKVEEHWLVEQLMPAGVLVTVPAPAPEILTVSVDLQDGKLKEAIRVDQLLPAAGTYSVVYQKVQSSVGSIDMLL